MAEYCLIVERHTQSGAWKRSWLLIDKSQGAFGTDHDWVSVDTNDQPVYKFGDAKRKGALSKVKVKVQPGGHVAHLHVHAQETEGVLVLLCA